MNKSSMKSNGGEIVMRMFTMWGKRWECMSACVYMYVMGLKTHSPHVAFDSI